MSKVLRAVLISAVATGAASAAWHFVTQWREKAEQIGGARAGEQRQRSREDEIEELTQQQKDIMLREMAAHV